MSMQLFNFVSMLGNTWQNQLLNDDGTIIAGYEWVYQLFTYLSPILYAIMAVVGAAGAIYAIVLGINLARAEDQSKRDEAKKHLIYTLIAVAVTVVLVIFFNELLPLIVGAAAKADPLPGATGGNKPEDLFVGLF